MYILRYLVISIEVILLRSLTQACHLHAHHSFSPKDLSRLATTNNQSRALISPSLHKLVIHNVRIFDGQKLLSHGTVVISKGFITTVHNNLVTSNLTDVEYYDG